MKKLIRFILYLFGLSALALGNVCSVLSNLGITATASVGYALSEISGMTLGTMTIITFLIFIIFQFIITDRKNYLCVLLQLPFSLFFSFMLDFLMTFMKADNPSWFVRIFLLLLGILFTSAGIVLTVGMRIVPTAPDGMVQTISERFRFEFGNVKNIFDLLFVLTAAVLGLVFEGRLLGTGAGTILSALLIGRVVKFLEERVGGSLEGLVNAGEMPKLKAL